jgi:hypothetical protein
MNEQELIKKLGQLKQVKPNQNWVSLTKAQILGTEEKQTFAPVLDYGFNALRLRFAMASVLTMAFMFGSYAVIETSLPGDMLYAVRKTAHIVQAVMIPAQEKPAYQLKLANDRLEDLAKAPAKNAAPTVSELQANIYEAVKVIAKIDATTSSPFIKKKTADEIEKLKQSLASVVGEKRAQTNDAFKESSEYLINDLSARTLTSEKKEVLAKMKELFDKGEYAEAFEFYMTNQ